MACGFDEQVNEAQIDCAEAAEIIKVKLHTEPSVIWFREGDFVRVTVKFNSRELKGIDAEELELISKEAIQKAFARSPDEVLVQIVSGSNT